MSIMGRAFMFFKKIFRAQSSKKILIVSLQKSGTHLIKRIMDEAGFQGMGVGEGCKLSDFDGVKNKQYLWSHFTPSDEIQIVLEEDKEPLYIIFNYRDPRDVLASWFYWLHPKSKKSMHPHQDYMKKVYSNFTDDELIKIFIRNDKFRRVEYNPIEHFRLSRALYFHPGVLKVRFEDLVGSSGGGSDEQQLETVRGIFNYLEINNIDAIKIARNAFDNKSATFRKGRIGGYREILTNEQLRLFNELHGDILRQYGYAPDRLDDQHS